MANFCGYCGASGEGRAYCTSCGQPMAGPTDADPTLQLPAAEAPPFVAPPPPPAAASYAAPPPPYAAPPPPTGQQPPSAPPPPQWTKGPQPQPGPVWTGAPASPGVNPFVGVPAGDYVRDAVAAFCLFAALGMPWDATSDGGDRWWVVISVLLSLASLALPYVGKARVVPGWSPQHVRVFKLAANVPFLASVVGALVNELVNLDDGFAGGLGTGIAMGLAGALLAAQPRAADEDRTPRGDRLWNLATTVVGFAAVAVGVLAFVAFFLDDLTGPRFLLDEVLLLARLVLVYPAMFLVVVGLPVVASVGGSPAWRRVLAVASFTVVGVALLALAGDGDGLFAAMRFEHWNTPMGGTFLVGALAALSVSRPQQRLTLPRVEPVTGWIATASSALLVSVAALALSAIILVLGMIDTDRLDASHIVLLVLLAGSAVLAVLAMTLLSDVRRNRPVILGLLGGLLLGSVISIALNDSQDLGFPAGAWATAMWFSLPGLAVYALTVPGVVRAALGPLIAPAPGSPAPGSPAPGSPAPYPPGPAGPPPQGYQPPADGPRA